VLIQVVLMFLLINMRRQVKLLQLRQLFPSHRYLRYQDWQF
jgi:hypothetical protein